VRIKALERELGEPLFRRWGGGIRLTDAGARFLPYAQRVLGEVRDGRAAVQALHDLNAGKLVIGAARSIGTYLLPDILRVFRDHFPKVEVSIHTGTSEQALQRVLTEEAHLGLSRAIFHKQVDTEILMEDELVIIAHPKDKLTTRSGVTMRELADEAFFLVERGTSYYSVAHDLFRRQGLLPRSDLELDSVETTKHMVAKGLGIALLPCRDTLSRMRLTDY
jgi:DNA-binding transcriptional LysR family regulator